MRHFRLMAEIHVFFQVTRFTGYSFGFSVDGPYESKHYCTRDFKIHFWHWNLSIWIEDAR
jgi:hypothetical protein